mmetsp:Transcript_12978/g.29611  ORF Transcript_12978/g.29611 Transcript_12978/m.29611 type:complete len:178 (+) Transcript_12978:370-903(+)
MQLGTGPALHMPPRPPSATQKAAAPWLHDKAGPLDPNRLSHFGSSGLTALPATTRKFPSGFVAKMGMKYVGAYLMAALAGNESPSADDIKKILESVESEYDEDIASKLVSQMEGKAIHEVVAAGKEKLKGFGGGGGGGPAVATGGGGGGGATEAKKEEKKVVEEEEEEEEMDFDLFG